MILFISLFYNKYLQNVRKKKFLFSAGRYEAVAVSFHDDAVEEKHPDVAYDQPQLSQGPTQ